MESNEVSFEYDVAFSFVSEDEALAQELADLLQDRCRVFLYSRRQEDLAGRDGEEKFNDVFFQQARIVVVLYRAKWGSTPFTRIEESAIKNRAYDEGYDFTLFIPTSPPPTMPRYVPRTRLYGSVERFGTKGIAGAIAQLVTERGGSDRFETIVDRAERVTRAVANEKRRAEFLNSVEGGNRATAEATSVIDEVERWASSKPGNLDIEAMRNNIALAISCRLRNGSLCSYTFGWRQQYTNVLGNARLEFSCWTGIAPWPGQWVVDQRKQPDQAHKFLCDLTPRNNIVWRDENWDGPEFLASSLSDHLCRLVLDDIQQRSTYTRSS